PPPPCQVPLCPARRRYALPASLPGPLCPARCCLTRENDAKTSSTNAFASCIALLMQKTARKMEKY
ncbi:MAG: hypothetical protein ACI4SU_05310, partial [Anaerovoracaceae bacterium]